MLDFERMIAAQELADEPAVFRVQGYVQDREGGFPFEVLVEGEGAFQEAKCLVRAHFKEKIGASAEDVIFDEWTPEGEAANV